MKTEPIQRGRVTLTALVVLCAFGVMAGSCARCDLDSAGRSKGGINAVLHIVFGEGGGFAGTWEGYTITGSGVVSRWKGKGARENEVVIGTLDADTMCVLWDAAKSVATASARDTAGSLVRFLSLTVQDTTHKFTWIPRIGQDFAGTPYQEFYDRCIAAIQRSLIPATTLPHSSGK